MEHTRRVKKIMKLNNPITNKIAALIMQGVVRSWMGTLDFKAAAYDPSVDPASPDCRTRGIYIFWHEYIPLLMYLRGNCDLAMLMSRHRDADILSRLAMHFGFDFVRGSTRRGGDGALREMIRKSDSMHLTITPDGPRGPRRELAAGCVYLASKLEMPIIAMGLGYDRPWRVSTWDQFAIPKPFSRARIVASPRIWIPRDLDREGLEHYRKQTETVLESMTIEAETWAKAGTSKKNQIPVRPTPRPLRHPDFLEYRNYTSRSSVATKPTSCRTPRAA
ncbi:MAG: hypothetical protein CMJ74_02160 [Planctomycetaceae bacterium]|nr:hypothetical protein [Planctomycetaceae bacterium]